MTCVLTVGPHNNCHFRPEGDTPPKEIHLRGPDIHTTAVYKLTDLQKGMWVYGKCDVTWDTPPRLVKFIQYDE